MTPDQAREIFIGNPARQCKCGSHQFHVPPSGGLVCSTCNPGDSILTLIAEPSGRKLAWQEFDPAWDAAPTTATLSELDGWDWVHDLIDGIVDYSTNPRKSHPSINQSPIPDNRLVRLRRHQTIVNGNTVTAGTILRMTYRSMFRDGIERAMQLRTESGRVEISQIPMDRLEVIECSE